MLFGFSLLIECNQQYMGVLILEHYLTRIPISRVEFLTKESWDFFAHKRLTNSQFKGIKNFF